jgi:copper homeostasis protein
VLLEVIAATVEDAVEAEQGGAGRIELVRELGRGGLTPPVALIEAVVQAVKIPVRVMLRDSEPFELSDRAELNHLAAAARTAQQDGAAGFVMGFLRDGVPDLPAVRQVLGVLDVRATFHHAFDRADRPLDALAALGAEPRIDRVLTTGGTGHWRRRLARLQQYRLAAPAHVRILPGGGLDARALRSLAINGYAEAHVGRAARVPAEPHGRVQAARVARLIAAAEGRDDLENLHV